jgi:hypothetical protein
MLMRWRFQVAAVVIVVFGGLASGVLAAPPKTTPVDPAASVYVEQSPTTPAQNPAATSADRTANGSSGGMNGGLVAFIGVLGAAVVVAGGLRYRRSRRAPG